MNVPNNVNARYWKRIREAFMRSFTERDFMACLIVQEILLESFAVARYTRVRLKSEQVDCSSIAQQN